jgi:hypothetical protein
MTPPRAWPLFIPRPARCHRVWQSRPTHPRGAGLSLLALVASTCHARMRSTTAIRLNTGIPERLRNRRMCWSGVPCELIWSGPARRGCCWQRCVLTGCIREEGPVFPQVTGHVVGLGGLEPPPSSLSAIGGLPLCNPAFSQVVRDRRGSSNAFLRSRPTSARIGHAAADKLEDQSVAGKVMGLPGGRGSPIRRRGPDCGQTACPTELWGRPVGRQVRPAHLTAPGWPPPRPAKP